MELLTTPIEIQNKICLLMNSYKNISFASAWAFANSKVKLFPNMNYMFQPAKIGGVDKYWKIETTFDESVADYMDK